MSKEKQERELVRERNRNLNDDLTFSKIEQEKLSAILKEQKNQHQKQLEDLQSQLLMQKKRFD